MDALFGEATGTWIFEPSVYSQIDPPAPLTAPTMIAGYTVERAMPLGWAITSWVLEAEEARSFDADLLVEGIGSEGGRWMMWGIATPRSGIVQRWVRRPRSSPTLELVAAERGAVWVDVEDEADRAAVKAMAEGWLEGAF